jgi:hypothetical protein
LIDQKRGRACSLPQILLNKDDHVVMNRATSQRAEEARRVAQSATLRAKQAQSEMLKERAAALAVEAQKIGNLRALRLAKEAQTKDAADLAASEASEAKVQAAKETRSKRRAVTRRATKRDAEDAPGLDELVGADMEG